MAAISDRDADSLRDTLLKARVSEIRKRLLCGWFVLRTELRRRWLAVCPNHRADYASFDALERLTFDFEELLRRQASGKANRGIEVEIGSQLEDACLTAVDLNDHHKAGAPRDPRQDMRPALRVVVGLRQLVEMILRAEKHAEFMKLVPHLRLLNEGSPSQNTSAPSTDQASNKILELLLAMAALRDGKDLDLDDPKRSSGGKNPDVIISMPDGRRWGFACKVVHGEAPMSLFELIAKGIKQIDAAPVDIGIVVLNFKNRLPHDQLFAITRRDANGEPVYAAPRPVNEVVGTLFKFAETRLKAMAEHVTYSIVVKAFEGSKALPGVMVISEAGVPLMTKRGPAASLVGITHIIHLEAPEAHSRFTMSVNAVLRSLNEAMHLR